MAVTMIYFLKPKSVATLILVTSFCMSSVFCKKNINDFSNLNKTVVNKIYYPSTEREIQHIIKRATKQGKKVSIAGKYHSQGGHAFYDDALLIDIRKFKRFRNFRHNFYKKSRFTNGKSTRV